MEPGVVLEGAVVAQSPVAVGDEPGDATFDGWPPTPVGSLPVGVGGGLATGGGLLVVVQADGQDPAQLVPRAPVSQRAVGAQLSEEGFALEILSALVAERDGVADRACHRCGSGVDVEVVQGETAGDGGLERGGFAEDLVSGCGQGGPVVVAGVGGVPEDIKRPGLIGQQVQRDSSLGVVGAAART